MLLSIHLIPKTFASSDRLSKLEIMNRLQLDRTEREVTFNLEYFREVNSLKQSRYAINSVYDCSSSTG